MRTGGASARRSGRWAAGVILAALLAGCADAPPPQAQAPLPTPAARASTLAAAVPAPLVLDTVALSSFSTTDYASQRVARQLGEALPGRMIAAGKAERVLGEGQPARFDMAVEVTANPGRALALPALLALNINDRAERGPDRVLRATVTIRDRETGALLRRFDVNADGPYPPENDVIDNTVNGLSDAIDRVAERIVERL